SIDLLVHAPGLLRCHIRQGPFELVQVTYLLRFSRELGGRAEIDEFRRQRFSVDRDIAGIDVFMHDASTLHGLQPPCQLYGDMQKGSQFKPVLRNQVHQGDGIEIFYNKKRTVRGVLKGMVEDDMGVCEGAPQCKFMPEPSDMLGYWEIGCRGLEDDRLLVPGPYGSENRRAPPFIDLGNDVVPCQHDHLSRHVERISCLDFSIKPHVMIACKVSL